MPEYSYACDNCSFKFSLICPIREYKEIATCPKCKKNKTYRLYHEDLANLSTSIKLADNELKTIGHLAQRNSEKLSDDHKDFLNKKHNAYRENQSDAPLPQGMSRIKKPKTRPKWT
jgi:putative FmdB family regulatory protein